MNASLGDRGSNRRSQPGTDSWWIWVFIAVTVAAVAVVYLGAHLGHQLAGIEPAPGDPWATFFGVLDGSVAWPMESSVVAAGTAALAAGLACVGAMAWTKRRRKRTRVDWTAAYLGRGREVEGISAKNARATADRLGVTSRLPGLPLGRAVGAKTLRYSSWEDMLLLLAGPRVGKSVAFAIPAILDAPGPVLVTSNKRDIVDATRDVRASAGQVWVFDPQGIANEPPTSWWWNPLSYVTDEVRAANLAEHFASGSRAADAKTDAFFDPAARDLLAGLLLAAALDGRPITDVYVWLTRPYEDEAVGILKRGGFPLTAAQVDGVIKSPEKQRGGVYGTAQQMASCLTNRAVLQWVTDTSSTTGRRREFDPRAFVREGGTLYSLSKEGRGTAGPLVTALTVAVVEAAEELATTQPGGRLRVPMVGVLDEVANVCRWSDLPNLYSHYGSRGIILEAILQSWAQGIEVWGRTGMDKLWSASNVVIYAGGDKEDDFLEKLSKLIGTYDKVTRSVSTRAGAAGLLGSGAQTRQHLSRERILDVDDLSALPKGRAVVLSSGNRPTMVETIPWMSGPHASAVEASIRAHDPKADETIAKAAKELRRVQAGLTDYQPPEVIA